MVDFMGMMKKAEELQRKMAEMQEEAGRATVEGRSGGGLVVVTLTGKGEMKGLHIDPSLFKEEDVRDDGGTTPAAGHETAVLDETIVQATPVGAN